MLTASMNRLTDFFEAASRLRRTGLRPSEEQGVLCCKRSFVQQKTYLAVFWRFERPRQTGKRRKPKGQKKRPPRRTVYTYNNVEKRRAGTKAEDAGVGSRSIIKRCSHQSVSGTEERVDFKTSSTSFSVFWAFWNKTGKAALYNLRRSVWRSLTGWNSLMRS